MDDRQFVARTLEAANAEIRHRLVCMPQEDTTDSDLQQWINESVALCNLVEDFPTWLVHASDLNILEEMARYAAHHPFTRQWMIDRLTGQDRDDLIALIHAAPAVPRTIVLRVPAKLRWS